MSCRLRGEYMKFKELTESEENLANIIWDNEPVKSSELVKMCEEKFGWKKSTTYTMLKRIEEKSVFKNEDSLVKSLISKNDYNSKKSKSFLEENFGGSLPKFLTAFSKHNKLSKDEINELQKLIDEHKEVE